MSLPTYTQICDAMETYMNDTTHPELMRMNVLDWSTEYSERNHTRMVTIVSRLINIEPDYCDEDFEVPEKDEQCIFKIGCDIHNEGGLTAQQGGYYIAINFVAPKNMRTRAISSCWHNAGDWKM